MTGQPRSHQPSLPVEAQPVGSVPTSEGVFEGQAPTTMKLIIQIPCYNEEESLRSTLSEFPRRLTGIETVEWR